MLGAHDYRGMSYIKEKFERKQLRHLCWIRSGLKIPDFSHIVPVFCIMEEKSTNKLHRNNASWMAPRKQFSDTLKSIRPTKQYRYFCCTKIQENTNIIVVVAYSMSVLLIKLNFRKQIVIFFITKHKEFLKHKESSLDLAIFFVL